MRRFVSIATVLGLCVVSVEAAQTPPDSVLYDCKMGVIENFHADPKKWKSKENTPFALLVEVDHGNQSPRIKGIKTVDPLRLMPPVKGNFFIRNSWPDSITVKIAPENNPTATSRGLVEVTKLATFTTPKMSIERGRTKAMILMANGVLTEMDMGGQTGTCAILQGDAARTRYSELSK